MVKQPEQQFYDQLFVELSQLDVPIYDYKPDSRAPYPFVELGEIGINHQLTKSRLLGVVQFDVHVWGSRYDRRQVSDLVGEIRLIASRIRQTTNFKWYLDHQATTSRIMRDNSTDNVLWHGISHLSIKFN